MDYKLARELRDAGFPQGDRHWYFRASTEPVTLWCVNALEKFDWGNHPDFIAAPTLEELIEACPQNYKITDYFDGDFTLDVFNGTWHAGYEHSDGWYEGPEGDGANPTEAVARLWLALNKKV